MAHLGCDVVWRCIFLFGGEFAWDIETDKPCLWKNMLRQLRQAALQGLPKREARCGVSVLM